MFENRGFPQCVGAIDGTHIPIITPKENPEDYFNRKHFYSINVQAICDISGGYFKFFILSYILNR